MLEILLPNWEIKQAVFRIAISNSFSLQGKQERESQEYQNCTNSDTCSGSAVTVPIANVIF
jgi:hypothetical protein